MGRRCRTGWNSPEGAAPTVWVGESAVTSDGVGGLEVTKLPHQEVVLGVGDLRGVEHVVALVVIGDQLAQFGRPGRRRRPPGAALSHGQAAMPAPTTASGSVTS